MCGIAALLAVSGTATVDPAILRAMADRLAHRGPDGAGLWIDPRARVGLAHRRLAIIDPDAHASQPMSNETGTIRVTFNGEIYNHRDLRIELAAAGHLFRSDHSDTEVLVHGYEEWGLEGLLSRLDGMFAFVLYDGARDTLMAARDRAGIKPLYLAQHGALLALASEIKGLAAVPGFSRTINPAALYHYLTFLTAPAPMTMFGGVWKLPAGCALIVPPGATPRLERYWDAVPGRSPVAAAIAALPADQHLPAYIERCREALIEAVRRQMVADVPVGLFLSGGIDSSFLLSQMSQRATAPVKSFTVGFKDHPRLNELDEARRVARHFGADHHEVLIGESDMIGYVRDLVVVQDEPIADWVCVPLHFVAGQARQSGVKVVLVGEGADELFCGYPSWLRALRLARLGRSLRGVMPPPLMRLVAALAAPVARGRPGLSAMIDLGLRISQDREVFWSGATVYSETLKRQLIDTTRLGAAPVCPVPGLMAEGCPPFDSYQIVRSFLGPFDRAYPGQDQVTRMTYGEFRLRLPELLLMRVDKITMSHSLEARVPFLDHRLIELAMSIPQSLKTDGGRVTKHILKQALRGVIPDEVIDRRKVGFGAPMAEWLRGDFGRQMQTRLCDSALVSTGVFDQDLIVRMLADHRSGRRDNAIYLWPLFNLAAWYDAWIDA